MALLSHARGEESVNARGNHPVTRPVLQAGMIEGAPFPDPAPGARQAAVILAAIDSMQATLDIAGALVAEGRRIDLAGLEDEAGRVCAAALAAPPAALPAVRRRLEALRDSLDRLCAGLAPP